MCLGCSPSLSFNLSFTSFLYLNSILYLTFNLSIFQTALCTLIRWISNVCSSSVGDKYMRGLQVIMSRWGDLNGAGWRKWMEDWKGSGYYSQESWSGSHFLLILYYQEGLLGFMQILLKEWRRWMKYALLLSFHVNGDFLFFHIHLLAAEKRFFFFSEDFTRIWMPIYDKKLSFIYYTVSLFL